ncbi:monocarboxylate transporter 13-like isoform X1 [Amphiura filiformis]|uniref:monocarboxylate transporter 13-like isoform X1 n=1 Tax=Amphiura filiformis TaxID=82378 RepID=UPI003B215138
MFMCTAEVKGHTSCTHCGSMAPTRDKEEDRTGLKLTSKLHTAHLQEAGWGWGIVFSNFLMLTLYFGLIFSLPVFFVEWMVYFDTNATAISWVISLNPAIKGIFSPFAGLLCTRFSSRKVTTLGAFVFSFGVFLSVFSRTVWQLCTTLCIITGIGSALIFAPTLLMLGEYFDKRYVFANSVAFLGVGFAQMLMPRFAQFLKDMYGWRGALLILSAVFSHAFVCAALLRPNKSKLSPPHIGPPPIPQNNDSKDSRSTSDLHMYDAIVEQHPGPPSNSTNSESKDVETRNSGLHLYDPSPIPKENKDTNRSNSDNHDHMHDNMLEYQSTSSPLTNSANTKSKDIETSDSSLYMNDSIWEHSPQSSSGAYTSVGYQPNENKCFRGINIFRTFASDLRRYVWDTYGLSLLVTNIFYIATIIGSFLAGVGWFTTNGHLVARATTSGLPEDQSALLLTVIGLSSIIGRISHGILIDKDIISRELMFVAAFALTSLSSFLNPISDTFWFLSIIAATFGFGYGIGNSLVFATMRVTVGAREAAAALSIGSMAQAVSNTLGGMISGVLYDVTGEYVASFVFAGTTILSGVILLFTVLIVYQRYKLSTKSAC